METHEVCNIFPMMGPDEYAGLVADIAAHGQREPVLTYQDKVIDGRNRLKACAELGFEPTFREWEGEGSLTAFVISLNLHRRHLTSGQRAAVGASAMDHFEAEGKEAQRASGGDRKSPEARAKAEEEAEKGAEGEAGEDGSVVERIPQPIADKPKPKARDKAAKAAGTNPRYIVDFKKVEAHDRALAEQVRDGKITLPQAMRIVKRAEKDAERAAKAAAVAARPDAGTPPWTIVVGDCTELLGGEFTGAERPRARDDLPCRRGDARLIFADPPYNIGVDYGEGHDDNLPEEHFLAWCWAWIEACARMLAPDGSMWVLINDDWAANMEIMLRQAGLRRRAWIKWYEPFGVNCSNNFNRTSRHLLYTVKDPNRFVFNADAVNRPSDRQAKYGDKRADPNGKIWDDVWGVNPEIARLVENSAERVPGFPTQLPLALLRPIVGCASDPGDLVLDPFNGSGTTGAACIELGRRYVGIEKSAKFAGISRMRLEVAGVGA